MLKPRYDITLDASHTLVGRAGRYDVWVEPAGITLTYMSGEEKTCTTRHSWSRFRSGVFSHWPQNLLAKLNAMAAMLEQPS